ncbi:MAG: hypothetical protein DWQ37_01905 [Planctomycetota bacterium]|nr:MAG: hypothetical protein DWQ37_01905 [Planctomycetota bacterium]
MITIDTCAGSDCAALAALWNAKRLDSASCWTQAQPIDETYVAQLMLAGYTFALATVDGVPSGFGFWRGGGDPVRLAALAADDGEVYYRLMDAFCDWALSVPATSAVSEMGAEATTESGWVDALGVIELSPIGFEPLGADEAQDQRVPKLLRATCDLQVLKNAVATALE